MLLWKRYSGVSPDRRLFTFCRPGSDPLATADSGAELDDGDDADFPTSLTHQTIKYPTSEQVKLWISTSATASVKIRHYIS